MTSSQRRYCVVGAGLAGLAAANSLQKAGIAYDCIERGNAVGGLWQRTYDSAYLISSRNSTHYADYPMPADYPHFPSAKQMAQYIENYARDQDLERNIRFNTEITKMEPLGDRAMGGWCVSFLDGTSEDYEAIVLATGHLTYPRIPQYPGTFEGTTIHTADYKNAQDFAGSTVLVVGAGNSGCDVAADAASIGCEVILSMRQGRWFLPKTFFGIPRGDLPIGKLPVWLQWPVTKTLLKINIGDLTHYGLPRPAVSNLVDDIPTINSQLLYWLQHGRIKVVPEIDNLGPGGVSFVDGQRHSADWLVWATGYRIEIPFIDRNLLTWEDDRPMRILGGIASPDLANLYFCGFVAPRGGGPLAMSRQGELIVRMTRAQNKTQRPLFEELFATEKRATKLDYLLRDWNKQIAAAEETLADFLRRRDDIPAIREGREEGNTVRL